MCFVVQKYLEGSLQFPNIKVKCQLSLTFEISFILVTCLAHVISELLMSDLTLYT